MLQNGLCRPRPVKRTMFTEANFAHLANGCGSLLTSSSRPSEARAGIAKRQAIQFVTIPDKALPFRDDGGGDPVARQAKCKPSLGRSWAVRKKRDATRKPEIGKAHEWICSARHVKSGKRGHVDKVVVGRPKRGNLHGLRQAHKDRPDHRAAA